MKNIVICFAPVALALAIAGACGGSSDSDTSGSGSTMSTTTGGGAGGAGSGGAGGGNVGCAPACEAPQICSVASVCIDPGTCAGDGDCEPGKTCDEATMTCVIGGGCGAEETVAEAVPPNLLIVLDRSCSMTAEVGGVPKWTIAVQAINTLTTTYNTKIRFGLSLFPDLVAPSCEQDTIAIPVAPATEMSIQELLNAALIGNDPYYPDGPCVTNIDTAMLQATTEAAFADVTRDSYALLLTDGKQSNGCTAAGADLGTTQIITDLLAMQQVPTFVVGFGDEIDPVQMDIFAEAGGVPAVGATKFYNASDQASLDAALAVIAEKTLGCVFTLQDTPPNPDEIFVFFDNTDSIPRDASLVDGWQYDPATNQVTFYGPSCDLLKQGQVTDVDIVFGCNEPTPE